MTIHLLSFFVKQGITLQANDVWESIELVTTYMPHKKLFLLFEGEEDVEISNEARRVTTSAEFSKDIAAFALFSKSLIHKISVFLFIKVNKPKMPTKFFDNRENAIAWLRSQQKTS